MVAEHSIAETTHASASNVDHAPLFVSLYTVLLAFFIMLNTIATPRNDKTEDILDSVKLAFAYDKPLNMTMSRATRDSSGSAMAEFTDAIEQHAKKFLPLDSLDLLIDGDQIQLTIQNVHMFAADGGLQPKTEQMLREIARSMQDMYRGYAAHIEVITNSPPMSIIEFYQQGVDMSAVERAGLIGRYLRGRNVPAHHMTVGLRNDHERTTLLRFTVVKADGSRIDPDDLRRDQPDNPASQTQQDAAS